MAAFNNNTLFEELGITGKIIELGKRFNEIDKMVEEDVNILLETPEITTEDEVTEDDVAVAAAVVNLTESLVEIEIEYSSDDEYSDYEYEYDVDDNHYSEQEFRRLEFVEDKYAEFAREFGYESD